MKTLILAGGLGTRLREIVSDRPKPMASIAGKPFLEHQILALKDQGLKDIILGVGHMANQIKSYFGRGVRQGVKLTYSQEDTPLGTAGAIRLAREYLDNEPFYVLNGDTYSDLNLSKLLEFHDSKEDALGSLALVSILDTSNYGKVLMNGDRITSFLEGGKSKEGLVNSGTYIFSPEIFDIIPPVGKVSLEKIVLPEIVSKGLLYGFPYDGHFIDIGTPETYNQFKKDLIRKLSAGEDITIREALQYLEKSGTDVLFITSEEDKISGVVNNKILTRYIAGGGDSDQRITEAMEIDLKITGKMTDSEGKIRELLMSGTRHLPILDSEGRIYDVRFRRDELSLDTDFPTIRGKSPLRISFAGGGTDLAYYFEEHGGAVISTTIDKYCHVTASRRADSNLTIESEDFEKPIIFDIMNLEYDGQFDIVKAAYNLANPGFGVDFHLRNDIPPGRGLGSSASLATLVIKMLGELGGSRYDNDEIAELAYLAEVKELGILGGKQDQYAAIYGGFNWMEFSKGNRKTMNSLKLSNEIEEEFLSHLTLCYTGNSHDSGKQHEDQQKAYLESHEKYLEKLERIKMSADEFRRNLFSTRPDYAMLGNIVGKSWENKRRLSSNISNPGIDGLYEAGILEGSYGGKLLGSGGGGYLLFFHPPKLTNKIRRTLLKKGGEILNFNFDKDGARTWKVSE